MNLEFLDHQKYIFLNAWVANVSVVLASRSSGKSYLATPFIMARSLLFPNHSTYLLAPSGQQSQMLFQKMEDLAKGQIASALGVTTFFLDECVKLNAKADPFTHSKQSYTVELYNGSTVNTLNSVAKNIVGVRSNLNVYDEAGKIEKDFFALTTPFIVQNTQFSTGKGYNFDIYPPQQENKILYLSSAESTSTELFTQYKICFEHMICGDNRYFACDIDCNFSLHPFKDGKPTTPLITEETVKNAMETNPYRAYREYFNLWDNDGGDDVFIKRSVINKYTEPYYPTYQNDGTKKFIFGIDPASRIDNSMVLVGELIDDEEKGLMVKLAYARNLIEMLSNNQKQVIQRPEQLEIIKNLIADFNLGYEDYDGLEEISIDGGAGGGGFDLGQFLMNEWKDKKGKRHLGLIDPNDQYMALRLDDYPSNIKKLRIFNFKRDKTMAYERTQNAINQGLVIFPQSLNPRNEIEFTEEEEDGTIRVRYEKVDKDDLAVLVEMDLLKEEIVNTQKTKRDNGTVTFELNQSAKSKNMHDDRVDCLVEICNKLMELRAERTLQVETKESDFKDFFTKANKNHNYVNTTPFANTPNPFKNINQNNPFGR